MTKTLSIRNANQGETLDHATQTDSPNSQVAFSLSLLGGEHTGTPYCRNSMGAPRSPHTYWCVQKGNHQQNHNFGGLPKDTLMMDACDLFCTLFWVLGAFEVLWVKSQALPARH